MNRTDRYLNSYTYLNGTEKELNMMSQEAQQLIAKENQAKSPSGECETCSPAISIFVKNGTAVISGTVCSNEDMVEAEDAVSVLSGIDQVFNLAKTV